MTHGSPEAFAAFVGIDWADAKHDGCLQAARCAKRADCQLEHTPEAIDAWGTTLRTRCNGPPVASGLALTKGPLVSALRKYDLLVLCPLNPLTLARYRDACTPSRAQAAPTDAALPLALRRTHRDTLPPRKPQTSTRRALTPRLAHRRRVGGDTVRSTHRLTRARKPSVPQVRHWVQAKDTAIFCDVLRRWPTRKAGPRARRATRATCFRAHPGRSADVIAHRLHALKSAPPLTTAAGVIAPPGLRGQALVAQLRVPLPAIADFATAIAQRAQRHPAFPLFQALPGAGPGFAPRLRVACGAQRARSAAAADLPP